VGLDQVDRAPTQPDLEGGSMNPELRSIVHNLEVAIKNKNWDTVDRATQRLAEFAMEER
jgi:hypothetical protein